MSSQEDHARDHLLGKDSEVYEGTRAERQSETISILDQLIDLFSKKKPMTPSQQFKAGMILGQCAKGTVPCIAELGQCGSAEDLKNEKLFPGGYKVWTTNKDYPVAQCTVPGNLRATAGVPVAAVQEEESESIREIRRFERLSRLLEEEDKRITNLLLFMDQITNCETFQEEESCTQPKMSSLGVTGKNGQAPRCLWKKDASTCGPSIAYEREIGAIAEKKLQTLSAELKQVEKALQNPKFATFNDYTRPPVALKGDGGESEARARAFEAYRNLKTSRDILENQIYAMDEARTRSKLRLTLSKNQYVEYQALVTECQAALDSNRSWKSCADESGTICQVLATGKDGGIKRTGSLTDEDKKKSIDDSNAFCVPKMGEDHGLYMHDPNTGRVFFYDNLGNTTAHTDPTKGWFGNNYHKLVKGEPTGMLSVPQLANIAHFGGFLKGKEMDVTANMISPESLRINGNLSARARRAQTNMQILHHSIAPYLKSGTVTDALKSMSKNAAGYYNEDGSDALKHRGDYTEKMVNDVLKKGKLTIRST